MITLDSGKFTIPEDERFVGFAGDNLAESKEIALFHHTVKDCTFYLCLRFDNGVIKMIKLRSFYYSSDVLLEWDIKREDLCSSGIVTAQIRIDYPNGEVSHSSKDYFFASPSIDRENDEAESITRAELRESISEAQRSITETLESEIAAAEQRAKDYTDSVIADLPVPDDYYTKSEIDSMIGNIEAALRGV